MKNDSKKRQDILEWVKLSIYDLETALAMQKAGRYLYVLFCCQQAVEYAKLKNSGTHHLIRY